jgi:predicted DNA-binding transcriptional regulator AlpA
MRKHLRYRDLEERGIVRNRPTLSNWIRDCGFPPGQLTGPNSRTWEEEAIEAWLADRPVAPKPVHTAKRPRGRPRKVESSQPST